ncbi:MAG TPA: hypothetical protein VF893_01170 [Candidatus Bathyarchaeia archaeon]
MNFVEACEFIRSATAFSNDRHNQLPKLQLVDAEKDGYTVWIKTNSLTKDFQNYLQQIAEERGLKIKRSNDFLAVQSF